MLFCRDREINAGVEYLLRKAVPFLAPPATLSDRVGAPKGIRSHGRRSRFVAEARKTRMEVQPMASGAIEKLVDGILRTPRPVVERARILLGAQNR